MKYAYRQTLKSVHSLRHKLVHFPPSEWEGTTERCRFPLSSLMKMAAWMPPVRLPQAESPEFLRFSSFHAFLSLICLYSFLLKVTCLCTLISLKPRCERHPSIKRPAMPSSIASDEPDNDVRKQTGSQTTLLMQNRMASSILMLSRLMVG
jgi:hypothetical protein